MSKETLNQQSKKEVTDGMSELDEAIAIMVDLIENRTATLEDYMLVRDILISEKEDLTAERAAHEETGRERVTLRHQLEQAMAELQSWQDRRSVLRDSWLAEITAHEETKKKLESQLLVHDHHEKTVARMLELAEQQKAENEKLRELCREAVQIQRDVTGDLHDRIARIEAVEERAKELGVIE